MEITTNGNIIAQNNLSAQSQSRQNYLRRIKRQQQRAALRATRAAEAGNNFMLLRVKYSTKYLYKHFFLFQKQIFYYGQMIITFHDIYEDGQ